MKILIFDDDRIIVTAIKTFLNFHGFEIRAETDSQNAKEIIDEFDPDIIVTDLMMPFVSGTEILDYVKSKPEGYTPVILISALDQQEVILMAFEQGADDFVNKPLDPSELLVRIKINAAKVRKAPRAN
jgi:DNA-binding response OmpR family regulator